MSPNFRDDFKREVKNLDDYVALVVVGAKDYRKTAEELINFLVSVEKLPGVYITLNKPYEIILRELKSISADNRLIIFIDAITKSSTWKDTKVGNCLFIGSPEKLSDLFVALDQAVNSIPLKEKFVFLDSLNTLTLFNTESTVARFTYQLVSKMRSWKIKGIIITLEKDSDDTLINELTQFCDIRLDVISG